MCTGLISNELHHYVRPKENTHIIPGPQHNTHFNAFHFGLWNGSHNGCGFIFGADSHDTIKWSLAFVIAQMRRKNSSQESGFVCREREKIAALVLCLRSLVVALDRSMCFLYRWFAFLANHIGTWTAIVSFTAFHIPSSVLYICVYLIACQ